jgi:threonine dehydratase
MPRGVAFSARQLGLRALIVMPATTPQIKLQAVKALGAEVVLHGDNYSEAADRCRRLADETGMTYIHPFDDELVISGQGTVADELLRQSAGRIDAVFVPVGGGGLIAGIACCLKELCPAVKVIGVEPVDSDAMFQSIKAGRRVTLESVGIFADGVAVRTIGRQTFELCRQYVDGINITEFNYRLADRSQAQLFMGVSVGSKKEREAFSRHLAAEGYRNLDLTDNDLAKTHLRYMIGGRSPEATRERLFRFWFPERPGALSRFLADMGTSWNISLFHYRTLGSDFGRVLIGLEIPDGDEKKLSVFLDRLGYRHVEETRDPA